MSQTNIIFIFTAMETSKISNDLSHFPSYQVAENTALHEPDTTRDISVLNYHNLISVSMI
jgi:hypothetical protein